MNDYRRPADYQIINVYECRSCGDQVEINSVYAAPMQCHCGGMYSFLAEEYPADSRDWHESRDDVNDSFQTHHS